MLLQPQSLSRTAKTPRLKDPLRVQQLARGVRQQDETISLLSNLNSLSFGLGGG